MQLFHEDTAMELRKETVTVVAQQDPEASSKCSGQETESDAVRLLSTRYGKTCLDVIIAKAPNTACIHEVQLKFLQD